MRRYFGVSPREVDTMDGVEVEEMLIIGDKIAEMENKV